MQLLEVERGWRDMKSTLELRPVYHRLEHRIRASVVLAHPAAEPRETEAVEDRLVLLAGVRRAGQENT
jgi:hypothetical protein